MISYQDIPKSYTNKNNEKVYYYRRKVRADGKPGKYVYIHDDEKHEIVFWLNRLVIDIQAKRVIDNTFLDELDVRTKELGTSCVSHKHNSYITFAAGVVCNIMRNPAEDLAYNQLKYIKELYRVINRVYTVELAGEIGYNYITKKDNPAPQQVKFKPA